MDVDDKKSSEKLRRKFFQKIKINLATWDLDNIFNLAICWSLVDNATHMW